MSGAPARVTARLWQYRARLAAAEAAEARALAAASWCLPSPAESAERRRRELARAAAADQREAYCQASAVACHAERQAGKARRHGMAAAAVMLAEVARQAEADSYRIARGVYTAERKARAL